jgi:hypothetical protein
MGPRFVFAALFIAFGVAIVFATFNTIRHVSTHTSSIVKAATR